ncbi:hypothetical protein CCP2SC5_280001 [Azospirillaceae bacterium]
MIMRLAGCYAHAWLSLIGRRPRRSRSRMSRWIVAIGALSTFALASPTPQSALAPVEIVSVEPVIIAAPIDGVIKRFAIKPNQAVTIGQTLFEFDDTTLRNQVTVAERTLGVALAELRQSTQGAMFDRKRAEQMALLDAQAQVRAAELDYARSLLGRLVVKAERDGLAVFTDVNDWIGKPVITGQRILQIADPNHVEAQIELAVHDAVVLETGAPVELFLDNDPITPLSARLTTASYEAETPPSGVISYRLTATFLPNQKPPRIGLHGIARISGHSVPLALYLFRRPLTALRQWIGY